MKLKYKAERCGCGHRTCVDWHVAPIAAVQGVKFTEKQARAVADWLNTIEDPALFAVVRAAIVSFETAIEGGEQ
jgi:hypothetical protein